MIKIILKVKKNKGPAPYEAKGFRSGFVILFAVTLSALILSIALGVANIAFREAKFNTSAKDTNEAFFAADTGAECALYYDRSDQNKFPIGGFAISISCAGNSINVPNPSPNDFWRFIISGLGSSGQGCAIVTVDKTNAPAVKITSKGYNNGGANCTQTSNTVERQLELNY